MERATRIELAFLAWEAGQETNLIYQKLLIQEDKSRGTVVVI